MSSLRMRGVTRMAKAYVDVEFVPELALDYVDGAESGLEGELKSAWDAVVAVYPGLSLSPLFSLLGLDALADMICTVRMGGEEPPDPFTSFSIACDDSIASGVRDAVAALPFVVSADVRPKSVPAGVVGWGTNPEMTRTFHVLPARV